MNVKIFLSLLSSISFAAVVFDQGQRAKAVRSSLLDAVHRHNTRQVPLMQDLPIRLIPGDKGEEYAKSNAKLYEFWPHFVTSDAEVNEMIFSLLNEHFIETGKLTDPSVYDELELMTLKIFFEPELFNRYPGHLLQYVLCFFHEMIFGINAVAPTNLNDAKIKFVQKLYKYDMPRSYEYLMNSTNEGILDFSENPGINREFWNLQKWREYLTYFYNRPSIDEVLEHASDPENRLSTDFIKPYEFQVILNEILYPVASSKDLFEAIITNSNLTCFSPEMFHWYKLWNSGQITLSKALPEISDFRFKYEYFSAIINSLDPNDEMGRRIEPMLHLYGCNSVNRFSLDQIEAIPSRHLFKEIMEFSKSKSFTLAQYEMFSKIVSSDLFSNEMIQEIYQNINRNTSYLLLHIIEFESNRLY